MIAYWRCAKMFSTYAEVHYVSRIAPIIRGGQQNAKSSASKSAAFSGHVAFLLIPQFVDVLVKNAVDIL